MPLENIQVRDQETPATSVESYIKAQNVEFLMLEEDEASGIITQEGKVRLEELKKIRADREAILDKKYAVGVGEDSASNAFERDVPNAERRLHS